MRGQLARYCLFVCLKEKLSPTISICSHIARGFEGEKNNDFCAWVRVRFQKNKKLSAV